MASYERPRHRLANLYLLHSEEVRSLLFWCLQSTLRHTSRPPPRSTRWASLWCDFNSPPRHPSPLVQRNLATRDFVPRERETTRWRRVVLCVVVGCVCVCFRRPGVLVGCLCVACRPPSGSEWAAASSVATHPSTDSRRHRLLLTGARVRRLFCPPLRSTSPTLHDPPLPPFER